MMSIQEGRKKIMSTKGPSFLYGNTKGSPTRHINFPYAKEFNKNTIGEHM
jgi:hypothetical protein